MTKEQLEAYIDTWPWATKYTPSYYESIFEESVKSRDGVFEELVAFLDNGLHGKKIIDVGCGLGQWGFEVKEKFRVDYVGIDFGVPQHKLMIKPDQYYDWDLRNPLPVILVDGKFDLAICVEVGEHLPVESSDQLIDTLCRLSDTVLFSAAIPGQGGIQHINEQWQSWWAEKFAKRGYYPYYMDIRKYIWNDQSIGVWYRQNLILYCKEKTEGECPPRRSDEDYFLDVIHPEMYMNLMKHYRILK
jgi:SAM-dependent methyltransferase